MPHDDSMTSVPSGAPHWVTPELLSHTLRVWRRYYPDLTTCDALDIIVNIGHLFDTFRSQDHEALRCSRAC